VLDTAHHCSTRPWSHVRARGGHLGPNVTTSAQVLGWSTTTPVVCAVAHGVVVW